jgi:hypothetical protein
MTRESLLSAVIRSAADRLAHDPRIPVPAREAYRFTAESVLRQQLSVLVGERVYLRVVTRQRKDPQRRARIVAALEAGQSVAEIAAREGVTDRAVRKVRAGMLVASSGR